MTVKVGIPRALLFYQYAPLWTAFFQGLGAEVVVSPETNSSILNAAIENSVDDACLPVKLYHGHVLSIKNKVDYIFIPRIMGISKGEHICPKFCGLPEMIKYSLPEMPPIIEVEINWQKDFKTALYEAGQHFSKDLAKIGSAYQMAYIKYKEHEKALQSGLLPSHGFSISTDNAVHSELKNRQKIMVLGHPYNLYDPYANMHALEKVQSNGIDLLTPEMLNGKTVANYAQKYKGKILWTFAKKFIGAAKYLLTKRNVDGIIYISAFGCGIDSVVGDTVERMIRRESDLPLLFLNLDEHTGEGGLTTRIEAFVDLLKWRGINESNVSSHG